MSDEENYLTTLNESLKKRSVPLPVLKRLVSRLRRSAKKKTASGVLKTQGFNLKVFETQLKMLETALEGDELTSDEFEKLPTYKKKQILTRLQNIKTRALKTKEGKDTKPEKFDSAPFPCFSDFEKCMKLKSTNVYWCHFAFYVCVLRSLLPFMK